jgi:hypothetical protein
MAQLSEWLELMLAEIARRQEEAQLNAEEEARRSREALVAPNAPDAATVMQSVVPTAAADVIEPDAPRRRRG